MKRRFKRCTNQQKALSAYWFEIDFDKITIVRSDRLKEIDREIESKTQMLSKIKVYLSGNSATKLVYKWNFPTYEDLNRAIEIAKQMVEVYGMGEKMLPHENDITSLENAQKEIEDFRRHEQFTWSHFKRTYGDRVLAKHVLKSCFMRYFSGFCFQNEEALFEPYLIKSDFTVAGFSYGAIKAMEYAFTCKTRIDTLQLFSPAFFKIKMQNLKTPNPRIC